MLGSVLNALLVFRTGITLIAAMYFLDTFFLVTKDIHQPWAFLFLFLMAGFSGVHRICFTIHPDLIDPLCSALLLCVVAVCMLVAAFRLNRIWKSF